MATPKNHPKPEPKIEPAGAAAPHIARSRTEDEMRAAIAGKSNIAPHYDTPVDIMTDAVEELLTLRQLKADVLAFVQAQQSKLTQR